MVWFTTRSRLAGSWTPASRRKATSSTEGRSYGAGLLRFRPPAAAIRYLGPMNAFVQLTLALVGLIEFVLRLAFAAFLVLTVIGIVVLWVWAEVSDRDPLTPYCWRMVRDLP